MATKKKAAPAKKPAAAKKKPAAAKKAAPAKKLGTKDLIKAANKTLLGFLAAGDAASIGKCYSKKAQLLPPGAPLLKGKNIAGFWAGAIAQGVKSGVLKTVEVDELGSTAVETGNFQLKTADGAVCGAGKYVVVWKKEGGAWKLHRDIFNSDS